MNQVYLNPIILAIDKNSDVEAIDLSKELKGHIGASRVTWGKKCGLAWELHGTEGTIIYNQERMNEIKLFTKQIPLIKYQFQILEAVL